MGDDINKTPQKEILKIKMLSASKNILEKMLANNDVGEDSADEKEDLPKILKKINDLLDNLETN